MPIQLTVIGLNRVGVSFGLALAEEKTKIYRCGHDPVPARTKKVKTDGAFDKIFYRMHEAVREADVVLLCLPVDQIEEALEEMADALKEGAVVINTAPVAVAFIEWAKKLLPAGRHFISMIPAISGEYLDENANDTLMIPHWDLFRTADMMMPTDETADHEAVSMASELTTMVGARTCFINPVEADGILAKTDLLPKLAASALLDATLKQPGWKDSRRVASGLYAKATSAVLFMPQETHPGAEALINKENALLALDAMEASLAKIRNLIENGDQKTLDSLMIELRDDRSDWLQMRDDGDWEKENRPRVQKSSLLPSRLFGDPTKLFKK